MREALPDQMLSMDQVAYKLGMSGSTLRRKLSKQGCSYREIQNKCRLDYAINLLKIERSVEECAFALHFSSGPSFTRWFKDLTGELPSEWRERHGVKTKRSGWWQT